MCWPAVHKSSSSPVRLVAFLDRCERPDVLLHLFAQLPKDARLTLIGNRDRLAQAKLHRLARAYGVNLDLGSHGKLTGGEPTLEVATGVLELTGPAGYKRRFATLGEAVEVIGGARFSPPPAPPNTVIGDRRFAVVTNHPTHYRMALLTRMASLLAECGASLRVVFTASVPRSRPWLATPLDHSFEHREVTSIRLPIRRVRPPSLALGVARELSEYAPDVVLVGGFSPTVVTPALRAARRTRATVGIWSGEVAHARTAQDPIRRAVRRRLVEAVDFGISYGSASAEYLNDIRPHLPTIIARNTTAIEPRATQKDSDRLRIVAVGDLADTRKGMDVLIDALALAGDVDCDVTVIGGGAQLPSLRLRAEADPRIRFAGALPPHETLTQLASSDVYVFPTKFDLFGLTLVEAMGAGLACVVSRCASAVDDLCLPDVNSIVLEGHDPVDWASAIVRLASDPSLRLNLGQRASATVAARWTLDHSAGAMIAGLSLGARETH